MILFLLLLRLYKVKDEGNMICRPLHRLYNAITYIHSNSTRTIQHGRSLKTEHAPWTNMWRCAVYHGQTVTELKAVRSGIFTSIAPIRWEAAVDAKDFVSLTSKSLAPCKGIFQQSLGQTREVLSLQTRLSTVVYYTDCLKS